MIPQLRKLEHKYPNELAVVGVEAGKFAAERVTANIRQAALRLEMDHPVVNDSHFRIWRSYAVGAWPTLVVVDAEGYVLGSRPGEITFEALDPVIAGIITDARAHGKLDPSPVRGLKPERPAEPERMLAFPGKVLATADGRLFIADSNHNRILEVALAADGRSGSVQAVIGSGRAALADGDYATAAFYHPQGLALDGKILYVADSENHAVRAIDLHRRAVTTLAGTGTQAGTFEAGGAARQVPLTSPWDVAIHAGVLYIAMAGSHQIWRLDLAGAEIRRYAGSGAEEISDGDLANSALAQPMGLAVGDGYLYFADSESSAVRRAALPPYSEVRTLVGEGLFEYGDRDGRGEQARLQHPQGLAYQDSRLYVADTYNDKIKRIDPVSTQSETLFGDISGYRDGDEPLFDEPGGLSIAGDLLFIADTNNHAIRVADMVSKRVSTLELTGV